MQIENRDLIPLSEFRRDITTLIEELQDGRREKVVVTRHGKVRCVVVAVHKYEEAYSA